jgi:signal transduction histidine kinase
MWQAEERPAGRARASTALAILFGLPVFHSHPAMAASITPEGAASLALLGGVSLVAAGLAIAYFNLARRSAARERDWAIRQESLRTERDRASLLLAADPQLIISWNEPRAEPILSGHTQLLAGGPSRFRVLHFESWLAAPDAQAMEQAVSALKQSGEPFHRTVRSLDDRVFDCDGRAMGGQAVLRIKELTGLARDAFEQAAAQELAQRETQSLLAILNAFPAPAWRRDAAGRIVFVNTAYAKAVEASSVNDAIERGLEWLEKPVRDQAALAAREGQAFHARVPVIFAGRRGFADVSEWPSGDGRFGIAIDVSDHETLRATMARESANHIRTLDQVPTAIAIFDGQMRLTFCNAAYRDLWSLDSSLLDTAPQESEILDQLRTQRRLPEQADFKSWKQDFLEAYRAIETSEAIWHLPDNRTLRVVTNPNPQGGVTRLFDDVTERFRLASQFTALSRVQSETIDTLREGVAVFGTDGRLKLHNSAFAELWALDDALIATGPHIDDFIAAGQPLFDKADEWNLLRGAVVGLHDRRSAILRRFERKDGSVLDCATAPLSDGATLITFSDVTASVNIERALKERAEALETAGELRDRFVHHVSYELRSPLTNVIGFTDLLSAGMVGALNEKQQDYVGHIQQSSKALMALIDDILDLASLDTGEMRLNLEETDISETIEAAVAGVRDRLAESHLLLTLDVPSNIGRFLADAKRVRQILFNLLSNAVGFSRPGGRVIVRARRDHDQSVQLIVEDEGRGIPADLIDRVFDRFETHTKGTKHRGPGLGLSLVRAFVELHGGHVTIQSAPEKGTQIICFFPAEGAPRRAAAE